MNAILQSNHYKAFERLASNLNIKIFTSIQSSDGATIVQVDLKTGKDGLAMLEKEERRKMEDVHVRGLPFNER